MINGARPKKKSPERTPIENLIEQPDRDEVSKKQFIDFLESKGVSVIHFEQFSSGTGWGLAYKTTGGSQDRIVTEMGTVAGTWAIFVDTVSNPGTGLGVGIYNSTNEEIGTYQILTSWAREYSSGEISSTTYASMILQTLKAT